MRSINALKTSIKRICDKNLSRNPSKYMEIEGSTQSADQHKREGWGCHGILSRYS
jgi:hypothetical protein